MLKLTKRQEEILNIIKDAIQNTGFPPTRAEIAQQLGYRSTNAAEEHLQALARKGVIEIAAGTSRGIRLLDSKPSLSEDTRQTLSLARASANQGQYLELPLIGKVAAGSPILATEHIESNYQVDPAIFTDKPDYLLRVKGLSMRDIGILDGDLLAVKKTQTARNGQIVVARIEDDVTVKRFQKHDNHIELIAENPDFKPIIVTPDQSFTIEGLAVGLLRSW